MFQPSKQIQPAALAEAKVHALPGVLRPGCFCWQGSAQMTQALMYGMTCHVPVMQRDSTQKHVKNLDVVLGADTSVLILDDTEGVWPQHAANLIQVDRYIFFPACATRFARSHKGLLEEGKDESAEIGMLSTSLHVLKQVHTSLFAVMLVCLFDCGFNLLMSSHGLMSKHEAGILACNLVVVPQDLNEQHTVYSFSAKPVSEVSACLQTYSSVLMQRF